MLKSTFNRRRAESVWWNLLWLTVGGILNAVCLQCISPAHGFLSSGVMGMALLANYWTSLFDASTWYILLSAPIFVWGWFFVSRRFLFYTAYGTVVTSAAGKILLLMNFTIPLQNEIYAAVLGGVMFGAGSGVMLRTLGSSGSIDIISVAMKQRWNIAIGQCTFLFNVVLFATAFSTGTPLDKIMASLIMMFISASVLEYVLGLFNRRKLVFIISDHGEEISEAILVSERFGVTVMRGKGAYSGTDREILLTVTNNVALKRLENLVDSIDPNALFIVDNAFYVSGGQFSHQIER